MKILVVTSHFFPEDFKCNDMAFELVKRGHEVTVLTPIPDYPQGRFFDGYGVFKRRDEFVNGVRVIRTLVTPRRYGSAKWLGLNYMTYTLFATLRGIWQGLTAKYDSIIVHETSPVMVGIPAVIVKKIQKIPLYFWVLDLWPESLKAAGGINNAKILGIFKSLTSWIYRNSDKILMSSKGFSKSICGMGDFASKLHFFPNWVDSALTDSSNDVIPLDFPKGFNVLFAGNIGEAQDMPGILDAAEKLKGKGVNFILVGDGRKRDWVIEQIEKRGLVNVICPGRFPLSSMPNFFRKADVLFLALTDNPIFALTVPAKLQAYMSSGKPVVAMINGEGADVIKEADCGWVVSARDSDDLAHLLENLSSMTKDVLEEKGNNGLKYCLDHYQFEKCMDNLEKIMS